MGKKATLKEVARLANVSTATVSHVINNTKYVSEDLKRQVYNAMETLNYQPNALAKSLKMQESKLIGVLISDIANPFFSTVVRGVENGLSSNGYNILLCNSDSDPEKERKYLDVLISKRVDGLIVSSAGNTGEFFKNLEKTGVPIVFLNRFPYFLSSNVIMTNNVMGAYMATEHLIRHGHRRLAIITGPQDISTGRDRLTGFQRALEDYQLNMNPDYIKEGGFDTKSGYQLMKELWNQETKPDACFISNNSMSLGAYKYLKEVGVKVPEDMALIGYDDPEWADIVDPPLTTVSQPAYEQGVQAAKLMLSHIKEGQPKDQEIIYLNPSLIIRRSCGCN